MNTKMAARYIRANNTDNSKKMKQLLVTKYVRNKVSPSWPFLTSDSCCTVKALNYNLVRKKISEFFLRYYRC